MKLRNCGRPVLRARCEGRYETANGEWSRSKHTNGRIRIYTRRPAAPFLECDPQRELSVPSAPIFGHKEIHSPHVTSNLVPHIRPVS